ncbi:MAG: YbjN domain-containing protein [Actinomycetales bacterium]|nr:YbjN domain-containing protein [Actinomycetales bacterium]
MSWLRRLAPWRRSDETPPVPPGWELPLTPLTVDRVAATLSRRGFSFSTDDDGDITGIWDGHRFWLMVTGEQNDVLQVRGVWNRTLSPERRAAARLAVNDWNRDRLWPKVFYRAEDDELAVYAEHSIDLEPGVNDAQLDQTVACGLLTGVQFFGELDRAFPAETAG